MMSREIMFVCQTIEENFVSSTKKKGPEAKKSPLVDC